MTSQQKWGERCQALECGRARYLPSLIALFTMRLWMYIYGLMMSNSCGSLITLKKNTHTPMNDLSENIRVQYMCTHPSAE